MRREDDILPTVRWFESEGILKFEIDPLVGYKAIVEIEQDISDYYRTLIPKYMTVNLQRFKAHISVVRRESPNFMWGLRHMEKIQFEYSNIVFSDTKYYWLAVNCKRLEDIRIELGLDGLVPWRNSFHITVGNKKFLTSPIP